MGLRLGFALFAALSLAHRLPAQTANADSGNEACASCHAEITKSYSKTVMATASGAAADGLITGEFRHKKSGVDYRVYQQDDRVWMSYARAKDNDFRGQRELKYFLGSGVKGRSYLFEVQGFWFETPINWYAQEHRWNMTPAYLDAKESPMNLPALVDCLNCHTSGMQAPVTGTESKFADKLSLHGGITCERCHGSGNGHGYNGSNSDAHVSGKDAIINPAKLAPERRDAICMECHFEGAVAVEQPGKHLYEFQPGERLADYSHYFLLAGGPQPEKTEALSQFEALSMSACKKKSGDKMWCGSCHDSHQEPSGAERVSYYRAKCLNCHGEAFGAKHHAAKPDCTQCHMPTLPNQAVAHTESTDHRILRFPRGFQLPAATGEPRLVPFPENAPATTRDLALAWETLAQRGVEGASRQAEQYLRKAVKEQPEDARVLTALGFLDQQHGHVKEAKELYERALKIDPLSNDAATNLGKLEFLTGDPQRAVKLWQSAFQRVPHKSAIGIDLAMAFCAAGQKDDARRYVERVLEFNPDLAIARKLQHNLNVDPVKCRP